MSADPVLAQQFLIDKTVCFGEREKADLSGVWWTSIFRNTDSSSSESRTVSSTVTSQAALGIVASTERGKATDAVAVGCMAQKGYVQVPEDQAEPKQQEFAAVAAEKARREAAAAAAAAQPPPTKQVAASPKPKPKPTEPQASPPPAQAGSLPSQN